MSGAGRRADPAVADRVVADRVVVGAIGKPLGIRGETYVHPDPDIAHDFAPGSRYELEGGRSLTVAASRLHGNRRVVHFAEASDRDGAEALRGLALTVPRADVTLEVGAHWVDELVGREVRGDGGEVVGVLRGSRDGPAHDYFVVARIGGGELLVPAVSELVELTSDALIVHDLPGLLDPEPES